MRGHRVLLLEKEHFPRYQIGESLLPFTVHQICPLLDVAEEIERAQFPRKYGGTLRWGKRPDTWTIVFGRSAQMQRGREFAYQVERARFDEILLRNAERKGVEVREGNVIDEVLFESGRAAGVRFHDDHGRAHEVSAVADLRSAPYSRAPASIARGPNELQST